jgi:hypothetical protein
MKTSILNYLKGTTSIIMHGSAARNEESLYSDEEHDILLGNLGFTVITKSPTRDRLLHPLLLRFLRNIDTSYLNKIVDRPLILLKPFEVSIIPYRHLLKGRIPPDIWVFEMVKASKIIYGDNMLHLFNTNFCFDNGFKMILNRLFGLNLCVPLIVRLDFKYKINVLAVNYECVKGILAALESLLVLLGEYHPSYSERGSLASKVVNTYPEFFDNPEDAIETFKLATELKLHPQGLDRFSPVNYWFKSRLLLETCFKIYNSKGITAQGIFSNAPEPASSPTTKIKESLRFAANNTFDPRLFTLHNLDETATKLMLSCVFSLDPESCGKLSKNIEPLVSASRYANFLHTRGEWHEITDHIKCIQPNLRSIRKDKNQCSHASHTHSNDIYCLRKRTGIWTVQ